MLTFIHSLGEGLDVYFGVICELLTSIIKRSFREDEPAWCASGVQTRVIAYSVLNTILQTTRGRHAPPKEIVALILKDIMPRSQQITLQVNRSKQKFFLSFHLLLQKDKALSYIAVIPGRDDS